MEMVAAVPQTRGIGREKNEIPTAPTFRFAGEIAMNMPRPHRKGALRQVGLPALGAALTLMLIGGTAREAEADLLVNEPFDIGSNAGEYTDGTTIQGQPSTTDSTKGWSGSWSDPNSGLFRSQAGGLEYTGIPGVTIGGSGGAPEGHLDGSSSGSPRRDIASNGTLGSASELWARVLWKPNSSSGKEFYNFRRSSNSDGRFTIRRQPSGNDLLLDPVESGESNVTDTFSKLSGGETHLMLFRLTIDRASGVHDTVDLWTDPTATSESGLGTPDASLTENLLDGTGDQLSQFDLSANQPFEVDEAAIGESFADVTMIPEPASALLLAPAGLLLLRRRRAA